MLGLDYQGQTALATLPQGTIVIKVIEPISLVDRIKANTIYRMRHHENVRIADSVYQQVVLLLRIFEQLHVNERIKLSYTFILREIALVSSKMRDLSIIAVNELVTLKDSVRDIVALIISELVALFENLKVNGKDIFHLWQACYKKVTAEVENVYKKFRR